jgi:YheC/D like ATP-grasp
MKASGPIPRFVVLGNLENRRIHLFQQALSRLSLPAATLVSWQDFLTGRVHLTKCIEPGSVLRIESPGENFEVEKLLLALGVDETVQENSACISKSEAAALTLDPGRIRYSRQWYLGFSAALQQIESQLVECPPSSMMNTPAVVAMIFDKRQCHAHLCENDIPVPYALPPIHCFDDLLEKMHKAGISRVFIKPAHGSSASGVVAFAISKDELVTYTSVEMVRAEGELRLYNSLKVKRYDSIKDIAPLIDALCKERVHVEQWLPKAGMDGQVCDLRVVVINGSARHVVVRCSDSPMTNLHLGNRRGDLSALKERMRPEPWDLAMNSCERAFASFPGCHYAGIDLLISNDFKRHAVLEMNAFGDLLPNILFQGRDTYETEIATLIQQAEPSLA